MWVTINWVVDLNSITSTSNDFADICVVSILRINVTNYIFFLSPSFNLFERWGIFLRGDDGCIHMHQQTDFGAARKCIHCYNMINGSAMSKILFNKLSMNFETHRCLTELYLSTHCYINLWQIECDACLTEKLQIIAAVLIKTPFILNETLALKNK